MAHHSVPVCSYPQNATQWRRQVCLWSTRGGLGVIAIAKCWGDCGKGPAAPTLRQATLCSALERATLQNTISSWRQINVKVSRHNPEVEDFVGLQKTKRLKKKKKSKSWGNWEAIQISKHADHCEVCFGGFVGFVFALIERYKRRLCHAVQQYSTLRGIKDILSEVIVLWWKNQKLLEKILFFPLSKYERKLCFWCFLFLNQCLLHWLLQRMKHGLRGSTVTYSTVCIGTYHGNNVSWSLLQSGGCVHSIHSHFRHQLRQAKVYISVDEFVVFLYETEKKIHFASNDSPSYKFEPETPWTEMSKWHETNISSRCRRGLIQ